MMVCLSYMLWSLIMLMEDLYSSEHYEYQSSDQENIKLRVAFPDKEKRISSDDRSDYEPGPA